MGLETLFKLSVILALVDNISGPAQKVQSQVTNLESKMKSLVQTSQNLMGAGTAMLATGTAMTAGLLMPVKATFDTKEAIGELASVGIKDFKSLENAALEFSNKYSGVTKAEFLSAAYDIKGGIASLSDAGVAEYTRLAALTAKATKATVQDMTSLFATGYGIYRDMYNKLDDMAFGRMFSGGISSAVNIFKTTGPQMAQAMTTLGAAATTANRPLEEQLTVLGMLQATMPGGEAGTKYRAFIQSAAKAGKELGLSFVDNKNQLLGMEDILLRLRSKYGETLDAIEKQQISKAFGTEEAVALIDLLYPKVNQLKSNISTVQAAMKSGTKAAQDMVDAMTKDPGASKWKTVTQQFGNLLDVVGTQLEPIIVPVIDKISTMILKMQDWAQKNPEATQTIWKLAMAIALVVSLLGGSLVGLGFFGGIIGYAGQGIAVLGKLKNALIFNVKDTLETIYLRGLYVQDALKAGWTRLGPVFSGLGSKINTVAGAVRSFGVALLTNPITWYVLAIIALGVAIYLLVKHWDKVKAGTLRFFNWFRAILQVVPDWILAAFPVLLLIKHWDKVPAAIRASLVYIRSLFTEWKKSGAALIEAFVQGIQSMIMKPYEVVKSGLTKLRNLLPFSDAKEGPLSRLTRSGRAFVETFAEGIMQRSGLLVKVSEAALAGVALTAPMDFRTFGAPPAGAEKRNNFNLREIFREAVTIREKETVREKGRSINLNYYGGDREEADQLYYVLKRFVEQNRA